MTNSRIYLRQIGISENQFSLLLTQRKQEIEKERNSIKIKKRGVPSKVITTESKLLLTLTYLRHSSFDKKD